MATLVLGFTVSPHHRIAFPASARQKSNAVFGTFLRNHAAAFGLYFEQLLMGVAGVFSHLGLRSYDRSAAAQTATVSVEFACLFSGQQITLDPRRTGPSSAQCELLLYESGHQHGRAGARLTKLLSERIRF